MALVDPAARVLAAVHAGWRGTAAGRGPRPRRHGAAGGRADRVRAFLGPAVAPERYQVTKRCEEGWPPPSHPDLDPGVARDDGTDHWLVDLVAANRQQLALGRPALPDHRSGRTTGGEDFFSHRAARPCGRFGLMARLLARERGATAAAP